MLRRLDDAVMPQRCVFCGARTRTAEWQICDGCRTDLPYYDNTRREGPAPFVATVAPLRYEFPVDAGLKAFKFKRRLYYGAAFGQLLCASMPQLPKDIDAVLPVPLHWWRLTVRGFNQASELGRPVARRDSAASHSAADGPHGQRPQQKHARCVCRVEGADSESRPAHR